MKTTLSKKLLRFILPLLVIPTVLMLVFYHLFLTHLIQEETIELAKNHLIHKNAVIQKTFNTQTNLQDYIQKQVALPPITIIDAELYILADIQESQLGKKYEKNTNTIKKYIQDALLENTIAMAHYKEKQFIISPLTKKNGEIIAFSICNYEQSLAKKLAIIEQTFLFVLLIVVFIIFINSILTIIFSFNITNPIKLLTDGTKIIANGNLSHKIDVDSDDEIGVLVDSFNTMVKKLQIAEHALQELNQSLETKVKDEVHKRREKEQILIQQSKLAEMGSMIGNIAHQWRQPLNALGLVIQNIEVRYNMGTLDEEAIKHTIEKGNHLVNSMSQTIDDFRNFFKQNKEKKLFFISHCVTSVIKIIDSSLQANNIQIRTKIDESLAIYGYPNEFSQVLINFINNAKDALSPINTTDKYIQIDVYKKDTFVYISISDNGGGIDESIINKVFDPYFTTKEEGKGTGIGLYMSKMIIETNMQGMLSVQNNKDGATFTIKMKESTR